jgi:hypothetical protein
MIGGFMSLQTKSSIKMWAKVASVGLFSTLFFVNIQLGFSNTPQAGNVSLSGLKVSLMKPTSAEKKYQCVPCIGWVCPMGYGVYLDDWRSVEVE